MTIGSPNNLSPLANAAAEAYAATKDKSEAGFSETLKSAAAQVQLSQESAQTQVLDLIQGNSQDVHGAMIAVEKANLSFELMLQVRNKMINAYQEISRLQF